jgi:hypothetical protein
MEGTGDLMVGIRYSGGRGVVGPDMAGREDGRPCLSFNFQQSERSKLWEQNV